MNCKERMNMNFGERLKYLRMQNGLSQRELAQMLGCSHQLISTTEKNKTVNNIIFIKKICEIFNVSADYLINGIPFESIDGISIEEMQLILKYRSLSCYYKSLVNHIIDSAENNNIMNKRAGE